MKKAILFEIGTEELPATQIKNITESLYETLSQKLEQNEFYFESKEVNQVSAFFFSRSNL